MIESKPLPHAQPAEPVSSFAPMVRLPRGGLFRQHPFFLRLLAGTLAVSLPVMLALSIGLTYLSSQRITDSAAASTRDNASNAALRLSDLKILDHS